MQFCCFEVSVQLPHRATAVKRLLRESSGGLLEVLAWTDRKGPDHELYAHISVRPFAVSKVPA